MRDAGASAYTVGDWGNPPENYTLARNDVHVWRIDLQGHHHDHTFLRGLLSADERERADRFIREEHGKLFTVGRAALRSLLAFYTGGEASALRFEYNDFGKPALLEKDNPDQLAFNVSHTASQAVVVIAPHPSVGIDIERYRETLELQKLAQRYFASAEIEALMALPEPRREEAFYRCWSSKEAFIKVIGHGLSIGLNNFEVEVNPDRDPAILKLPETLQTQGTWACAALPMGEGLSGVVIAQGELETLHLFHYQG